MPLHVMANFGGFLCDGRPVAIEGALGAEAPPRWSLGPATLNKLLMLNYVN